MEPIYVVLIINMIVWTGVFGYIVYLNSQVKKLKKRANEVSGDRV
ncbi:MAG: CcmD family protein [Calditrichaceae bacterium]